MEQIEYDLAATDAGAASWPGARRLLRLRCTPGAAHEIPRELAAAGAALEDWSARFRGEPRAVALELVDGRAPEAPLDLALSGAFDAAVREWVRARDGTGPLRDVVAVRITAPLPTGSYEAFVMTTDGDGTRSWPPAPRSLFRPAARERVRTVRYDDGAAPLA